MWEKKPEGSQKEFSHQNLDMHISCLRIKVSKLRGSKFLLFELPVYLILLWQSKQTSTLPKAIYIFNAITIQISIILFEEIKKKNSKTQMESQGSPASQNNLEKEQSWRPHTSLFQYILQSNSNQNSAMLA